MTAALSQDDIIKYCNYEILTRVNRCVWREQTLNMWEVNLSPSPLVFLSFSAVVSKNFTVMKETNKWNTEYD